MHGLYIQLSEVQLEMAVKLVVAHDVLVDWNVSKCNTTPGPSQCRETKLSSEKCPPTYITIVCYVQVALVLFEGKVTVCGDGTTDGSTVQGATLSNYDQLLKNDIH